MTNGRGEGEWLHAAQLCTNRPDFNSLIEHTQFQLWLRWMTFEIIQSDLLISSSFRMTGGESAMNSNRRLFFYVERCIGDCFRFGAETCSQLSRLQGWLPENPSSLRQFLTSSTVVCAHLVQLPRLAKHSAFQLAGDQTATVLWNLLDRGISITICAILHNSNIIHNLPRQNVC